MSPQESARLAVQLRAVYAALRTASDDRNSVSAAAVADLRQRGVAEADATWLAEQWIRNLAALADELADPMLRVADMFAAADAVTAHRVLGAKTVPEMRD